MSRGPRNAILAVLLVAAVAAAVLLFGGGRHENGGGEATEAAGNAGSERVARPRAEGAAPAGARAPEGGTVERATVRGERRLRGTIVPAVGLSLAGAKVQLRRGPGREDRGFMSIFEHIADRDEAGLELWFRGGKLLAEAEVDEDGGFVVEDPPAGSLELALAHPLQRLAESAVFELGEKESKELAPLRASAAGLLVVSVTDLAGRPVAGAKLKLAPELDPTLFMDPNALGDIRALMRRFIPLEGKTDAGGHHDFAALPAGKAWNLSVEAGGFARSQRSVRAPAGRRSVVTLRLVPGARLTVRLADTEGKPISGARIEFVQPDATRATALKLGAMGANLVARTRRMRSDDKGEAVAGDLEAGRVEVHVRSKTHLLQDRDIEVALGESFELDFVLERGLAITGRVVDEDGRPIPGAKVGTLAGSGGKVMGFDLTSLIGEDLLALGIEKDGVGVDSDGRFTLAGLDEGEELDLLATAEHYAPKRIGPVTAGDDHVEFVLGSASSVSGRVVRAEDGEPMRDFEVALERRMWIVFDRPVAHTKVEGSEDGSFRIENAPRGSATLVVTAEARSPLSRSIDVGRAPVEGLELRLDPPSAIEGVVVDAKGAAVPGAEVRLAKGGMADLGFLQRMMGGRRVETDAEGRFRLAGLPARRVKLIAEKAGYPVTKSRALRVRAGKTLRAVRIELSKGGTLEGSIIDARGGPLEGWQISATSTAGATMRNGLSRADGSFTFEGLAGGSYQVQATSRNFGAIMARDAVASRRGKRRGEVDLAGMIQRAMKHIVQGRAILRDGATSRIELVWEGDDAGASGAGSLVVVEGAVRVGGARLGGGFVELVELGASAQPSLATVEEGSFRFDGVRPGVYRARVRAGMLSGGYLGSERRLRVGEGERQRVDFDFPGGRIAGRVVYDESGEAAGGVLVGLVHREAASRADPLAEAELGQGNWMTDAQGGFAFDGLAPGEYEVIAREIVLGSGGKRTGRLASLVLAGDERKEGLTIHLSRGGVLRLRVQDPAGPVRGALVHVLDAAGRPMGLFRKAISDREGVATFAGLPEGSYRFAIDAEGRAPLLTGALRVAGSGEREEVCNLRGGIPVRVTIEGSAPERTVSQFLVFSIWRPGGGLLRAGVLQVPATGGKRLRVERELGPLESGRYRLRVEGRALGSVEVEREVPARGEVRWKIDLDALRREAGKRR